jgi:Protein of unknown function/AsmA-like C-terminal region
LVRRSLRICLEVFAAFLAGFVIVAGFLVWRLADGHPYHLKLLVPLLERSLAAPDNVFRVKLDDVVIRWTGGQQLIGLRALGVRAIGPDGRELARVPQIGLRLSLHAMMRGVLAPTEVEVFEPEIHMRRNADGRFQFLATIAGDLRGQPSPMLPEVFSDLREPPSPNRSTGYLRRVHLIDGRVELDDQRTGLVWHAPKIDIEMLRDRQGISGNISAQIVEFGDPALFEAHFVYDSAARDVTLHSQYRGVDIASLGLILPELTVFAGSHLQFDGTFDTWVGLDGHFGPMTFTVNSGSGTIDVPERFRKPLPVASLRIAGQLDEGLDAAYLDSLLLDLGGPKIFARGRITGLASSHLPKIGRLRLAGHVSADDIPVARLPDLWPMSEGHASNARSWVVENIDQGKVEHAEADFDVAFAGGDLDAPTVQGFGGKLRASGLGLHYLNPLPPIRGAQGTATFDANKFVADFASGGVGQLVIQRGHLAITALDQPDQIIAIEGDVAGPLKDALQLLDNQRLGYPHRIGIDPANSAGTVATHLRFRFPARKNLPFEQVDLAAKAKIADARLGAVFFGHDLSAGNFELQLDRKGMVVAGKAKLAEIPADLRWQASFEGPGPRTRIALTSRTSTDALAHLGYDYRDILRGPLVVDLVYSEYADRRSDVAATAAIDFAKWRKPAGVPGHASLKLDLERGRPVAISAFRFDAGDFNGDGRARFAADGKLAEAVFTRIALGKTQLTDVSVGLAGERLDIVIGGGAFDAQPFLDLHKPAAGASKPPPEPEEPTQPYSLTARRLDRVLLGAGREIDAVRVAFVYDGLHWQSLDAEGLSPGGKPITLRWLPAGGGTHALSIIADDAGAAVKMLGIVDNVVGGKLTITGTASDAVPKRPIHGHVEISEYRLINQSALARLLSIATLTGLVDMLTGEGFLMYRFTGDFTKTRGRIDVPLARTYGPSLGLTASGYFDFDTDQIDIRGTVVPAYALNSLVGQIPVIGYLLTGGEGTGVFAVIYTATGKLSQPTISVNPLSALAPGFLRGLFNLFPSGGGGNSNPSALPPNARQPGRNDR